ncbi:MAG: hypothetical protein QXG39_00255 [Candidatus Aenigmatarchaeota archaeon]
MVERKNIFVLATFILTLFFLIYFIYSYIIYFHNIDLVVNFVKDEAKFKTIKDCGSAGCLTMEELYISSLKEMQQTLFIIIFLSLVLGAELTYYWLKGG